MAYMRSMFLAIITIVISSFSVLAEAVTFSVGDYYYIASALNYNMVLDISGGSKRDGANVQLYKRNNSAAQLFKFEKAGNGYYYIVNKGSGKVLDVQGGATATGTNVWQYSKNYSQAQQWKLYTAYGNKNDVSFKAKCGKFLDVSGGSTKNGTNIWIYDGNNTKAQAFRLIPYVNTSYVTKTLNFSDLDSWKKEMDLAQRSVVFGGKYVMNPSGNYYYTGNIITGMDVLVYKNVNIKIPVTQGPAPVKYETKTIKVPQKIRFKLHKHNNDVKMWFNFSYLNFWQSCECGYHDEWRWDVPWPDTDGVQTTKSTIRVMPQNNK